MLFERYEGEIRWICEVTQVWKSSIDFWGYDSNCINPSFYSITRRSVEARRIAHKWESIRSCSPAGTARLFAFESPLTDWSVINRGRAGLQTRSACPPRKWQYEDRWKPTARWVRIGYLIRSTYEKLDMYVGVQLDTCRRTWWTVFISSGEIKLIS